MRVIVSDGTAVAVIVLVRDGEMIADGVSLGEKVDVSVKIGVCDKVDVGTITGVASDSFDEIKEIRLGNATIIGAIAAISAIHSPGFIFLFLLVLVFTFDLAGIPVFVSGLSSLRPFEELSSLSMISSYFSLMNVYDMIDDFGFREVYLSIRK